VGLHRSLAVFKVERTAWVPDAFCFYRLHVFPIALTAVRDDIAPLVRHFVDKFRQLMNKTVHIIPPVLIDGLERYSWPGTIVNWRILSNAR
jgi:transcriptional regulator with PAS, ATPase and Fis domain